MNSFSNFGSMLGRGGQNVNSIGYINRSSKDIRIDFSGTEFIDLSFSPYAVTSSGLNHIINGNTTIARLKYNQNYLKSTDFTSSSFTIYLKHAARYSTLPPFNLLYPSAATVSNAVVLSGSDFSVNFYSLLDPGSEVRYAFSGCTTTELNGTSLTGTVTAPYGTVTKTFTRANYAIFPTVVTSSSPTISCGAPLPVTTYAVTVSGDGLFYINELRSLPTMTAGNVYLFDQSNSTNIGNTLVFGTTLDSTSYYTTGVFTNGTTGFTGAYTLLNYTSATLSILNYYSRQTAGMGPPPQPNISYTFESDLNFNNRSFVNSGSSSTLCTFGINSSTAVAFSSNATNTNRCLCFSSNTDGRSYLVFDDLNSPGIYTTVSLWINVVTLKSPNTGTGMRVWNITTTSSTNTFQSIRIFNASSGNGFKVQTVASNTTSNLSTATLNFNTWHHIVCIFNPQSTTNLYINGAIDTNGSIHTNAGSSDTIYQYILGYAIADGEGDKFYLDDLALYDIALSSGDISYIYSNTASKGTPTSPIP